MFWYVRPQYQACKQKGNSQMVYTQILNKHGVQNYRGKKVHDGNFKTNFLKLGLGLNLKDCTSSFAPASQQRIKRLNQSSSKNKYEI